MRYMPAVNSAPHNDRTWEEPFSPALYYYCFGLVSAAAAVGVLCFCILLKYIKKCRCDKNCNNAACGWDGLDCEAPSEEKRASELPGNLYVVLTMSMANFNDEIQKRFERYLSIKMGTNLKIKRYNP